MTFPFAYAARRSDFSRDPPVLVNSAIPAKATPKKPVNLVAGVSECTKND